MSFISIQDVCFSYDEDSAAPKAVDGVSLDINAGEFVLRK